VKGRLAGKFADRKARGRDNDGDVVETD
jgi:hypothetical protein